MYGIKLIIKISNLKQFNEKIIILEMTNRH